MNRLLFSLLIMIPMTANSAVYKIGEFKKTNENYLDIGVSSVPQGHYKDAPSFQQLVSSLSLNRYQDLYLQIQGFPNEAIDEVTLFYETRMAQELKIARASKGNLNNPAVTPLAKNFTEALKNTSYIKEIRSTLEKSGYRDCKLSFEKFELFEGKPYVAEVSLECKSETKN